MHFFMQIKLASAFLALILLVALASPAPAPVATVPVRRRTFQTDTGVVDMPALQAHIADVQA